MAVTLRPVVADDESLLFRLYASTRAFELSFVPWEESQKEDFLRHQFTAQQEHYKNYYRGSEHQIIISDEEAVGRIYVAREDDDIKILDITILPEKRGAGIGTPIIKELMLKAETEGLPLSIQIETFNPSARLFERLGFVPKENNGLNILFEWRPAKSERKV
jgi:RimJ/RimL family protein N-acetyltransferase